MRPLLAGLCLLFGLALPAGAPAAADYPYDGYFATGLPDENPADTRLLCANGFFRQARDGSYVNYHLDPVSYARDGTIRYVQYGRGLCGVLDGGRIEVCRILFSTETSETWSLYVDLLQAIGPDTITVVYFDDVEAARAALAGDDPMPESSFFARCPGFTDETLAGHLTTEMSTLSSDDRDAVLYPELDAAARARAQAILDRLRNETGAE